MSWRRCCETWTTGRNIHRRSSPVEQAAVGRRWTTRATNPGSDVLGWVPWWFPFPDRAPRWVAHPSPTAPSLLGDRRRGRSVDNPPSALPRPDGVNCDGRCRSRARCPRRGCFTGVTGGVTAEVHRIERCTVYVNSILANGGRCRARPAPANAAADGWKWTGTKRRPDQVNRVMFRLGRVSVEAVARVPKRHPRKCAVFSCH